MSLSATWPKITSHKSTISSLERTLVVSQKMSDEGSVGKCVYLEAEYIGLRVITSSSWGMLDNQPSLLHHKAWFSHADVAITKSKELVATRRPHAPVERPLRWLQFIYYTNFHAWLYASQRSFATADCCDVVEDFLGYAFFPT